MKLVEIETSPAPSAEALRVLQALRAAVQRFCPPELRAAREDLVHSAQLRLLEIDARREQSGPRSTSYLWRVAYTTVVDEIRRLRRRSSSEPEGADGPEQAAPQPRPQLRLDLRACLAALLEGRRAAVLLHLEGFRAEEVGGVLRMETKRAQNLIYRGLRDLRRCLQEKGHSP